MIKLWVDDLREPPTDDWVWAKTSTQAINVLMVWNDWLIHRDNLVTEMSLDHDLGGDDTTRPVVLWMCEHNTWPTTISIHTMNPVGREWLEGMITRYKPD